jgi:hypothetical protein
VRVRGSVSQSVRRKMKMSDTGVGGRSCPTPNRALAQVKHARQQHTPTRTLAKLPQTGGCTWRVHEFAAPAQVVVLWSDQSREHRSGPQLSVRRRLRWRALHRGKRTTVHVVRSVTRQNAHTTHYTPHTHTHTHTHKPH